MDSVEYNQNLQFIISRIKALDVRVQVTAQKFADSVQKDLARQLRAAKKLEGKLGAPQWGTFWIPQVSAALTSSMADIEDKFNEDLRKIAPEFYKTGDILGALVHKTLKVKVAKIPEGLIEIGSHFDAGLITGMGKRERAAISKQIATSVVLGEPLEALIDRVEGKLKSQGSFQSTRFRAEVIARTETARIQELAQQLRSERLAAEYPDIKFYRKFLVQDIGDFPCPRCNPYRDKIYDLRGIGLDGSQAPAVPVHPNCRCALVPYQTN